MQWSPATYRKSMIGRKRTQGQARRQVSATSPAGSTSILEEDRRIRWHAVPAGQLWGSGRQAAISECPIQAAEPDIRLNSSGLCFRERSGCELGSSLLGSPHGNGELGLGHWSLASLNHRGSRKKGIGGCTSALTCPQVRAFLSF